MPRKSKWSQLAVGLAVGLLLGLSVRLWRAGGRGGAPGECAPGGEAGADPLAALGLEPHEDAHSSNRTLVLVGVMTAAQYLDTRARAVADTWGRELPGRLAFFSSEGSRAEGLPLVALRGVDDGYPPQKKSFLMLMYMYERYGDRFEWYMRADDDVYVRGDRLEELLRAVDSRKPQFVGQAGRGTGAERDALALDYNENFCMGGPGVLVSRETLRRVAPHVRYCLRHLYTSHEDVELGRCVAKFAGVSCTWSYDMQTILHHNSSGAAAYTGRLKRREVHRAITLHPVKNHRHMYRLHSHFKNLHIQELRSQSLSLHRELRAAMEALGVTSADAPRYRLPDGELLLPTAPPHPDYLGDNALLGAPEELTRFRPSSLEEVLPFDFISKSIYTYTHSNPKRRIETPLKEALDDVIREAMDIINAPSRQRGRVIEFTELLYGYTRLDPLHGADHVLDLLLRYRRYRGRKLTAAVRRHAYLQQSFTGMEIRELPMGEPPPPEDPTVVEGAWPPDAALPPSGADSEHVDESKQQQSGFLDFKNLNIPIKEVLETGLNKLQNLPKVLMWSEAEPKDYPVSDRLIKFILPLAGRQEIFARFMNNYEAIVLKNDEAVDLVIVLYLDWKSPDDYMNAEALVQYYRRLYPDRRIDVVKMGTTKFSRGAALTEGATRCREDDLLLFIDVDMMFNIHTLTRIRINTIKNYQVYSPIVFSEYDPAVVNGPEYNRFPNVEADGGEDGEKVEKGKSGENGETEVIGEEGEEVETEEKVETVTNSMYSKRIDDNLGYFRQYGFGILSIYKCDLTAVGGFDLSISGWGLEDVQLFEHLIRSSLSVLRAPDPSLVHVHHAVHCAPDAERAQHLMCLGTRASTHAGDRHLAYYLLNHPEVLWPPPAPAPPAPPAPPAT